MNLMRIKIPFYGEIEEIPFYGENVRYVRKKVIKMIIKLPFLLKTS